MVNTRLGLLDFEKQTHSVSGERSQHDGREALVEGGHALLPDQLPQDVPEAVGILSFWGCRDKRRRSELLLFQVWKQVGRVHTTAAGQSSCRTGSFKSKK